MKNIEKSIKFYYATAKLKETLRSGPVQWRVEAENKETIADHVYGTLMLAIALRDVIGKHVDFEKTFFMLALHEVEEILIGDFTPLDKPSDKEKREMGDRAVNEILNILGDKHNYKDLLDEFNNGQSKEARFAKACDKLECVLEFKKYCDRGLTSLDKVTPEMLENKYLKAFYDEGKYALDDIFYIYHMKQFEDLGFTDKLWFETIKPINSTFAQNTREK